MNLIVTVGTARYGSAISSWEGTWGEGLPSEVQKILEEHQVEVVDVGKWFGAQTKSGLPGHYEGTPQADEEDANLKREAKDILFEKLEE